MPIIQNNKFDILSLPLNISSEIFMDSNSFYVFLLQDIKAVESLTTPQSYKPELLPAMIDFMVLEKGVKFIS